MKKTSLSEVPVSIDSFPNKKEEPLFQEISKLVKDEPKKAVKNILKGFLTER